MTKSIPEDLKNMIINSLDINRDNIIYAEHILDISSANQITSSVSKELRWKDFKPRFLKELRMPMITALQPLVQRYDNSSSL